MAQGLRFMRSAESGELPFLVRGTRRPTSMSICRYWRSLPRLKRTMISFFVVLLFFGGVYSITGTKAIEEHRQTNVGQAEAEKVIESRHEDIERVKEEESSVETNDVARNQVEEPRAAPKIPTFTGPTNDRQRAVVAAFQYAWKGYKEFAWGHDQLKPVSKGFSDWFNLGMTIVDGLDTAIIMGLKQEVEEGTEWIRDSLTFEHDLFVNLFETTIRVLGGLLTAFHLTGNTMFADRASVLGDRLLGAYQHSSSAVPLSDVNLHTKAAKSPAWGDGSLSEVTTIQLEFRDLARITGNKTIEDLVFNTSVHIHQIGCPKHKGLCGMFLNANTGRFKDASTITFGARADSYYEYLLKQWIQTGKQTQWLLDDYKQAMDSMKELLYRESEPNKYPFVGELLGGDTFSPKMDHLACFLPGTLALGTLFGLPAEHLEWAKGLGATCSQMYNTTTGMAPEIVHFNMNPTNSEDVMIKPLDAHSLLRPEAFEAWFYLHRITGDKIYQEWGWRAFEAIEKYAKISTGGYSSVNSVKAKSVTYRDLMESFFLAESLKYLYLLLGDDQTLLPLDKWIFNSEGHPLPARDH